MTDNNIIEIFKNKNGQINTNKTREIWLNKHNDIKKYLLNRYPNDDFISYTFVLKRIFNNIEELPKCHNCGKKLYNIYGKWCNSKCQLSDPIFIEEREKNINYEERIKKILKQREQWSKEKRNEVINKMITTKINKYGENFGHIIYEKIKQTNLKKYGVENSFQEPNFIEKSKQTCKEKYGYEYYRNPQKTKQTIKDRYNIDNWMASDEFRNKSKETKRKLYGNENYVNTEKSKQTCLKKYGVDNWGKTKESILLTHTKEINNKRIETKRKNNTFNASKIENESHKLLKEKYPDVIYQYSSELYPFNCDFYIPSLDLYIECNYHWTHGGKPYENTKEDNLILEKWKNKNTKFYNNAIKCWTERDVNKRNKAKENNLNYIEFWNIEELKKYLNNVL